MNGKLEVRVLGTAGIEDHHAHLLRLDVNGRSDLAQDPDDHAIDAYCLRLLSARAILIGAYVDGILRAALELLPDRTARRAEAIFTAETGFRSAELAQQLVACAQEQARKYRFCELQFHGLEKNLAPQSAA
jgi:hypothetical protein